MMCCAVGRKLGLRYDSIHEVLCEMRGNIWRTLLISNHVINTGPRRFKGRRPHGCGGQVAQRLLSRSGWELDRVSGMVASGIITPKAFDIDD